MNATTDADVDALVRRALRDPTRRDELVALLAEDAPIYRGRSTAAAGWIRAWLMAKFADIGLPAEALAPVLEVLHNDREPRAVAAAAVASRGMAAPDAQIVAALIAALRNLRGRDERVDLRTREITSGARGTTTAALEVLAALRWQPAADGRTADALEGIDREWPGAFSPRVRRALADTVTMCRSPRPAAVQLLAPLDSAAPPHDEAAPRAGGADGLESVVVQDQAGTKLPLRDYLSRSATVVAFFYTRCQNPNKCSTTITKLARLQRELATASPRTQVAAITYDPGYDLPERLLRYGADRGVRFSDAARMFRAVVGHEALRTFFALHVGYNGSMVNRHGIELFLVAADLTVAHTWSRVQWQVDEVVSAVLLTPEQDDDAVEAE